MKSPISFLLKACTAAAIVSSALSSCSVSSEGPEMAGASHGALGSANMSDYYYKKEAGWTYTFSCVENVYSSSDEDVKVASFTGPDESVYTMGFDGFAPNGDSIFRYQIKYKITSKYYAGGAQPPISLNYIPSTRSNRTHGAWVDPGYTVAGMTAMSKRPRPVSTDTILAGVAGRLREVTADFENNDDYSLVDCMDTLWVSSHLDSVYIWERQRVGGPLVLERCIFIRDFVNNNNWTYDVINNPNPTTTCLVDDKNSAMTVSGTDYSHVVKIRIKTSEVDDKDFNREWKYYANGIGIVYQWDWFYTTTDGNTFTKKDFARSLKSLSHSSDGM